jgi:pimeloyl-ACP methyl ester carboxylesterase
MTQGYQLPADATDYTRQSARGFGTPTDDTAHQTFTMLPKRVIPVIFLPGIMGANLRISDAQRQQQLGQANNQAWWPDAIGAGNANSQATARPRERQLRLDPTTTAVDIYNPQGPSDVSGDGRHSNVQLADRFTSPLLTDDPPGTPGRRTASQKARARGWGEVYFGSYGRVLQQMESRLNNMFWEGKPQAAWADVVGVNPGTWMPDAGLPQTPLSEAELKQVATRCFYPVYAFGYNWLQSNAISAKAIAPRIIAVIEQFKASKFDCDQVILVTHSMGGLVARALIHPDYGDLQDKVLGIVHGVMPAIGAAAAYKRIRAGFEDPGMFDDFKASVGAKIAGNYGDEVTAVLANAPGGLELLPNQAYGNGWLQVTHKGQPLETLPKQGDPYEEIYKLRGKWYGLIANERWINPAGIDNSSWKDTVRLLGEVKAFHAKVTDTYHDCSYAHYGADRERRSFGNVVWEISRNCGDPRGWQDWPVLADSRQGTLDLARWSEEPGAQNKAYGARVGATTPTPIQAVIQPPNEPGDQTVPIRSADHQLRSGKFKAIFRQTGYEHQGSYQNDRAIACTLYSIVRIAQRARR